MDALVLSANRLGHILDLLGNAFPHLEHVEMGATAAEMIAAVTKTKQAGLLLSVIGILVITIRVDAKGAISR